MTPAITRALNRLLGRTGRQPDRRRRNRTQWVAGWPRGSTESQFLNTQRRHNGRYV